MINYEKQFIFVHIPKTAGESIEKLLFNRTKKNQRRMLFGSRNKYQTGELQHLMAHHIKEEVGPDVFSDCFKFSFVRNPWDKLVSQFHFSVQYRKPLRDLLKIDKNSSFKDYLNSILVLDVNVQWDHQHKFVYHNNECLVDFIGRFENLQEDFKIVCDKIGIPRQELPHSNKSTHKHYTEYYDDETREIVAEKYAKDIEMFGYEFGE